MPSATAACTSQSTMLRHSLCRRPAAEAGQAAGANEQPSCGPKFVAAGGNVAACCGDCACCCVSQTLAQTPTAVAAGTDIWCPVLLLLTMYSLPRVLSRRGSDSRCFSTSTSAAMMRSSSDLLLHSPIAFTSRSSSPKGKLLASFVAAFMLGLLLLCCCCVAGPEVSRPSPFAEQHQLSNTEV